MGQTGKLKTVANVANVATGTGEALANVVDASIYFAEGDYGDGASSAAGAAIGALSTAAGTGKFGKLNKSLSKTAASVDVNAARKSANSIDVDAAHANQLI